MIKLSNITIPITIADDKLSPVIAKFLKTSEKNIQQYKILKKSLDARKKDSLKYVYNLAVSLIEESPYQNVQGVETYLIKEQLISELGLSKLSSDKKVAIIGAGPCGLFAALTLVECGVKPIIIERGYEVDRRKLEVEKLYRTHTLNEQCNIQFGEGGAGTFSDGKLNTGTKSAYITAVLGELARFSSCPEVTYLSKPHLGTDVLSKTIVNIRNYLIERGATFLFGAKLVDFSVKDNKLKTIFFEGENNGSMEVDALFLAIGHSARDTFELILSKGANIEQKPFSIGVRIEHLQEMIDISQYGSNSFNLPSADYKLAAHLPNGRGVYTFCMCPGGEVVCGSSERGGFVTNGMSYHDRRGKNANSALLVSVETSDFVDRHPLAGVEFQRKYEKLAFANSNSYKAPVSLLGDLRKSKISTAFSSVTPSYRGGTVFADLRECLPKFAVDGILQGAELLDRKLKGFNSEDAVLSGVETRSSSPIRILRDDEFQSNIKGLYPLGEGCGYAGGITSAAVDGIKGAIAFVSSVDSGQ